MLDLGLKVYRHHGRAIVSRVVLILERIDLIEVRPRLTHSLLGLLSSGEGALDHLVTVYHASILHHGAKDSQVYLSILRLPPYDEPNLFNQLVDECPYWCRLRNDSGVEVGNIALYLLAP